MTPDSSNDCDDEQDPDGGPSNGNGSRSDEGGQGEKGKSGEQGPSTAEKAVMVVSVAFTVSLLVFAGWQMATVPTESAEPRASTVGTETMENGSVAVTVRLRNPKDVGLVSATVSADCSSPPPEVAFAFVPADSDLTGTIVCPPGTNDPSVSMASWVSR